MIRILRPSKHNGVQAVRRIGSAVLYLGQSEQIIPHLQPVSAVITDPPYAPKTHRNAKTNKKAAISKQLVTFDAYDAARFQAAVRSWLSVAEGWCVATCDLHHGALLYDWPEYVRRGIWVKQNPVPQMTGDRPGQGHEEVAILHAGKRRMRWNRRGGPGTWITPVCNKASVPTEKPLQLISAFVSDFTSPGEVVLDPFAGSGTTGVACLQQGRGFVGIEVDPDRFAIAHRRLQRTALEVRA